MHIRNRRGFIQASAGFSIGVAALAASETWAQTAAPQGKPERTAKHTSDVRLTHDSPIASRLDDKTVGIWLRAAPRKHLKNVSDVEITLKSLDVMTGKFILEKTVRLSRATSFITRFQYPCSRAESQQELSIYFRGEQIKSVRVVV